MSHIQDCCFKTYNSCYYAAKNGHLQCLRYAHENGCHWNERTFYEAAYYGSFECLKYLIAHDWKTWKQLKPQILPRYGPTILKKHFFLNNSSWTVSNYVFLAGMIQPSSYIYKHFYNHSLFDLNLINDILSLL